ncbi:Fic family protein [Candidatus Woesearchaeota archaeon]|nr:Fic family protein [Candidatus Woesearchaeota archaeon]
MIAPKLYAKLLEKKKKLDSLRPLTKLQLKVLKEKWDIEYIYNSTAIEGNTLSLNETKLVLEEGITIGGKSLREHLDVSNQKEAIKFVEDFVKDRAKKIAEQNVLFLHKLTLKGISDYWAGRYKESQNRILGSKLKTTPPYRVRYEMQELVYKINQNPQKLDPILLASFAHHELVRIHPFVDGNGRTARLLTNLILIKNGYPPIIIRNNERKKYFSALERAHSGDLKPFANFIAQKVDEALTVYINALIPTTKENELIPLRELYKETQYSQEYLSLMARKGIISAVKIGDVWHSSREEIKKYLKSLKKANIGIG